MEMIDSNEALDLSILSVVEKIRGIGGDRVRFVVLYGSAVKGEATIFSDIDLAVFYDGDVEERFGFRKKVLGRVNSKFDVQTFQDLPLYLQKDVLLGNVIYFRDFRETFDVFMKTIKEFEDFKPCLEMYYSSLEV